MPPSYSQTVGAAVGSSEPPLQLAPQGTTSASLYAYGRSLYLTLNQYRHRPEPANTINMANRRTPDSSGLASHTILFAPESAKRPDSYRDARSTDATLVIDYELLASLPPDSPSPASAQATSPAVPTDPSTKGAPGRADPEIEALRKELEDIKRQLTEQQAERNLKKPAPQK